MTSLDERFADLLSAGDDPRLTRLVAELDTLGEGSPSPRRDLMIRHALAVHARDLAEQAQPAPLRVRRPRWTRRLQARVGAAVAASVVLLGLGSYIHGQGATPVSAQTVLHRAAAASPGANEATHASYHVTSGDGRTGSADVWVGYDAGAAATELALSLDMSPGAGAGGTLNARLAAVGNQLLQLYKSPDGSMPTLKPPESGGQVRTGQPSNGAVPPAEALQGIVVGSLLAANLSSHPDSYKLEQETLGGVPVYALQFTGGSSDSGPTTFYFNANTYVLEGADWQQGNVTWKARLDPSSYRTMPLSSVPAGTFPGVNGGMVTMRGPASSGPGGVTRSLSGRSGKVISRAGSHANLGKPLAQLMTSDERTNGPITNSAR